MTTDPTRFRHRTTEIEAVQWTGSNADALRTFCGPDFEEIAPEDRTENPDASAAVRESKHGTWRGLEPGYWVVKIGEEFYEESPADFAAQFEPVPAPAADRAAAWTDAAVAAGVLDRVEPVCKFAEGCHRVEGCEPGCAVTAAQMYAQLAAAPAETALRDRIAAAVDEGFRLVAELEDANLGDSITSSVLAVLPAADRSAEIRAQAFTAAANYVRGHSADERYGKASISTVLCAVSDELYLLAAEERAEREAQAHLDQLADELPAVPAALRLRVLREVIGRIENPGTEDSATEDVGAAQVLAALKEILADLEQPACPDPIECGHEAALGQAQQEVKRLGLMVDEYGHGASTLSEKLQQARATNRRLNLRAQKLESELAAYRKAVADWKISDTGAYVPLRTLAAIAKAAGVTVPDGWELHYERVERLEAAEVEVEQMRERHKASLRRADKVNNELMEEVQRYAIGAERPVLWSVYNRMHSRAAHAEAALNRVGRITRRLAAHAAGFKDVLDASDHGPWGRTVGADIAELIEALSDQAAVVPAGAGEEPADETPVVCEGFQWIGQPFRSCDRCGQPAWEHVGEDVPVEGAGPFDNRRTVRPWGPGEADRIRAKWAPAVPQPGKEH